jgi:hypothetical protein
MHELFISYSSHDKPIAEDLCARLEEEGLRCWIAPRDLMPGDRYTRQIKNAVRNGRMLVLVLTAASNVSPHVHREVERAVHYGLTIIPVRVENVFPGDDLEYLLCTVQWFDALDEPHDKRFRALAGQIRQRLSGPEVEAHSGSPVHDGEASWRFAPALGRRAARDRTFVAAVVALALLPVVADFVLHLHVAPPWPSRLAVDLFTGLIGPPVLFGSFVAGVTLRFDQIKRRLARLGAAVAVAGLAFLTMRSAVVWNAPTPHYQDVGGFVLRPNVRQLVDRDDLSVEEALNGYDGDPMNVWLPWTVVVSRLGLLVSWLTGYAAAAAVTGLFVVLLGHEVSWG